MRCRHEKIFSTAHQDAIYLVSVYSVWHMGLLLARLGRASGRDYRLVPGHCHLRLEKEFATAEKFSAAANELPDQVARPVNNLRADHRGVHLLQRLERLHCGDLRLVRRRIDFKATV